MISLYIKVRISKDKIYHSKTLIELFHIAKINLLAEGKFNLGILEKNLIHCYAIKHVIIVKLEDNMLKRI